MIVHMTSPSTNWRWSKSHKIKTDDSTLTASSVGDLGKNCQDINILAQYEPFQDLKSTVS